MTKTAPVSATTKTTQATVASTKDTGKVHVGGGTMRFASTLDTGKVLVGGGTMRF